MKRILCIVCLLALLCGCTGHQDAMEEVLALRAALLSQGVSFDAVVTADYGDRTYQFALGCQSDSQGELKFQVLRPETIAGISGTVSAAGGKLTFDNQALAFSLLADGQISPVSAPWILMHTLRGGYLTSCTKEGDGIRVSIDDSYEEDALHLDIWLDANNNPVRGEILWQGRRILSMQIETFAFL